MKDPKDSCVYILSAMKVSQFPTDCLPEVAFSGRSNVGKSSLLNLLTQQNGLAKVSKTPGKTRAVNFFDVGGEWRLVDLPGYGYAKRSKAESESWRNTIDAYLTERPNLVAVIQLIDSRHDPTALDLQMMEWLASSGKPTIIALTKVDKLGKNPRRTLPATFKKTWLEGLPWAVIATSASERTGRGELLAAIQAAISTHKA